MSVPQRISFLVGWAGEPARRRLIENGARSQLLQTLTFWESFLILHTLIRGTESA